MKKLACTVLLLTSAFVQAGFDEGLVAANKGDYPTAFKEWKPLAEQGDADAQRITLQLHNSKNFAADLRKLLSSQN